MYESLRRSAEFPEEKLAHFDSEGAEDLLYEMRNLGIGLRPATAEYIVDNNLDPYVSARPSERLNVSSSTSSQCCCARATLQA